MKIDLKDFQELAVKELMAEIRYARREVMERDRAQAIILSSPTGSGKTVTITALMERILQGDETHEADREAVFLWFSDSPELNSQSRDKILTQSTVFCENELVVVESTFSREQFESGKVYFLNTQKLGKDNLLTKTGDGRDHAIWQTIENTSKKKPSHFYLIIDEAHRGMNLTTRERNQAQTIVQKFIFGDPAVGLSPIRIIIGISATPERFATIIEGSQRTKREHLVDPAAVRISGLLKEKIVLFFPDKEQPTDWTLLAQAAKRWKQYGDEWKSYAKKQSLPYIDPVLVVQVQDREGEQVTRTDLEKAVKVLERETGTFGMGALAHCFDTEGPISTGGYQIRKVEASKIQQDSVIRVVFFKTALGTGWDCPRAEVIMSFRRAQDHTAIAQLVGRMVRTPLARRIEGNELLNTVSLYLPHYDRDGLNAILTKLNDPENAPPMDIVVGANLVSYKRNFKYPEAFSALENLPSYFVERIQKISDVRRLIKLARQLTIDGIDPKAWAQAKSLVVNALIEELERCRQAPEFAKLFKNNQTIKVREVYVEAGEWKVVADGIVKDVPTTAENIDDLFDVCGRLLGEGIHKEFWKAQFNRDEPLLPKIELYGILQDETVGYRIEAKAKAKSEDFFERYKEQIKSLPSSKREEYNRIRRLAKEPQTIPLILPQEVELIQESPKWSKHLFVDHDGNYGWAANSWESAVLTEEMADVGFVAWLRNVPRKYYSFCIPYLYGDECRPLYPDLLVFRKRKEQMIVDVLEPHSTDFADAMYKAKGMALFAQKHGDSFGRIELIAVADDGSIQRLDMNQRDIRQTVNQVRQPSELKALFNDIHKR